MYTHFCYQLAQSIDMETRQTHFSKNLVKDFVFNIANTRLVTLLFAKDVRCRKCDNQDFMLYRLYPQTLGHQHFPSQLSLDGDGDDS